MDKVIIITGASSGFGKAMAARFSEGGAKVVLVARKAAELEDVAASIRKNGGNAITGSGDVTKPGTFEKVLAAAMEKFGRVDVLINNAGGGVKIAPIEEMDDVAVQNCLDLNLTSVIRGCRTVVPQMKKQGGGVIINVTSACECYAWPEWSVYSAAKAGVAMFSRCLFAELRKSHIGVTVLVPGGSVTNFQKNAGINRFEWDNENALRPEHIAEAAFNVVNQSKGAIIPKIQVYGMEQEIIPF